MNIPLVPLRDVVIFPGVVTPLFVGRESSINSLQKAMSDDKSVMLVAQREANTENPSPVSYTHLTLPTMRLV